MKKVWRKKQVRMALLMTVALLLLLPQAALATAPAGGNQGQAATEQLPEPLRNPPKKVPNNEKPPIVENAPTPTQGTETPAQAALPADVPPPPAPVQPETPGATAAAAAEQKTAADAPGDARISASTVAVAGVLAVGLGAGIVFVAKKKIGSH